MSSTPPPDDAQARRKRRGGRGLTVFLLIVVVELVVVGGYASWTLLGTRQDLQDARQHAVDGRAAVRELELTEAQRSFAAATAKFEQGSGALDNPAVRVLRFVPGVGDDLQTAEALSVAGGVVSAAATDLLAFVNEQPDGLQSFLPADGRFPVQRLAELAERSSTAQVRLADAAATVDGASSTGLLGPVADARTEFITELEKAGHLVDSAAGVSGALATFLGSEGPKRYLFGAQNPAELRGTGGYIGAYAEATFDRGGFDLTRFRPIQSLTSLPISDIPPPNADYAARYNRYGGAGFWPAINATPDFPSAAQAMERLYERTEDVELDGVMVVDPFALEALLRLTGEVRVPGLGRVDADNAVAVMSNKAYEQFASPDERKEVLGAVAAAALRRLLDGGATVGPSALLDSLAPMVRERHLLLYSAEPAVQRALRDAGLAGALPEPVTDTVSVVVNNAAVNKVDFFVDRAVEYSVQLRPDGSANAELKVTFNNTAPAGGPPSYVLGPVVDGLDAGDNLSLVSIFCGRCEPTDAQPVLRAKGPRKGTVIEQELGHTVATTLLTVPSATERVVELSWQLDDAWSPDGDGCYELRYVSQSAIRAPHVEVRVTPPRGYVRTSGADAGAGEPLHSGPLTGDLKMKSCYAA
ncbi:hypothetical protein BH23ACT10_BH23ACT10_07060 [soil metagenome]